MSEWAIWAGVAHRVPVWCFGGLDGQAVSPFPFVLSFLGLRYRTRALLSQARRGLLDANSLLHA